jgi:hypothetical protein
MDDSGWRCRIRWVVVRPDEAAVLLIGAAAAPALPEAELPGQVWTAEAEATAAVARELVGFDVASLWCVEEHDDQAARVQRATLAAAPRGEAAAPPGARWVGREELGVLAASGSEVAAAAARVLDELAGARPPAGRAPWARPGWLPAAEGWLRSTLAGLRHVVTGPVRQVRVWELSCVLRAPTDRGAAYLKATVSLPLFVDEGAVTRALAGLFPGRVPAPLAVDAARGWMLLADFGQELGWDAPVELREDVVRAFARLQVEAAGQAERLLAAACLDRRLGWLAAEAAAWLPAVEETGRLPTVDAATWLSAAEVAALGEAVPRLVAMCGELAAHAVPASLVHGDLHLSNVARRPGGYVFFDWSDACVAHPFVDLHPFFQEDDEAVDGGLRARLRDAYLAEWTSFAPAGRLLEAWRLAEPLGALHHAVSYRSIVASVAPPIDRHMAQSTAYWLRRVLAGVAAAGAAEPAVPAAPAGGRP